jgi:Tol biopolymer transport system component
VAFETLEDASIAIHDLTGTSQYRRLTLEGTSSRPVWAPDGTRIAFRSVREGRTGLFVQNADGSADAERLTSVTAGAETPLAWSADDRILFVRDAALWMFSLKDRRAEAMPDAPRERAGALSLSHDGWMAFSMNQGRPSGLRIFMRKFPTGPVYQVSRELANAPVWSRDGRDLFFYQTATRTLVSARVSRPPAFAVIDVSVIPVKSMFQPEGDARQFDVMPNGELLILQPAAADGRAEDRQSQRIHVVMNWRDELARVAPRR